MTVVWREAARADVVRIIAHISAENPIAARQIGRELVLAGDSLVLFPRRGRPGRVAGTREHVTLKPYIIVYELRGADVHILNVWHGAQDRP